MSDNLHPVRRVTVGELTADIDEELASIIEVIWRLGLQTWTCCQNQGESNASWGEILRRLYEFEAGRVDRPGPIDRSSIGR